MAEHLVALPVGIQAQMRRVNMAIQGVVLDAFLKGDNWPDIQKEILNKLDAMKDEIEDTMNIVQKEENDGNTTSRTCEGGEEG